MRLIFAWSGRGDLNSRPPVPHTGALPTAPRPDFFSVNVLVFYHIVCQNGMN